MRSILTIRDYRVYYKTSSGYVKAVDGVNLELGGGEILGLIGESGSGKTTLIMSLIQPKPPMRIMGGSARFQEIELVKLKQQERKDLLLTRISIIPQYALDSLPVIKKIRTFLRDLARDKKRDFEEVVKVFSERARLIGLPDSILDVYPLELSGGMRQRVVIAIATMFSPDLLIADEPTSALDVTTQRHVLELLKELRDRGIVRSLIYITHDIATVRQIADKLAVMYAGKIVEVGSLSEILSNPKHPYTKKLLESVPTLEVNYKNRMLKGLSGSPPSLLNPPTGCRFHPRCPLARDICRREEPPLVEVEPGHYVACWLYAQR
ncbi:MAG: ABC transporter ATP-binding protein [Desulfurococcus sp.]|nr:ABC transporter ATP-binding protein [Desulfurococcus sp.]